MPDDIRIAMIGLDTSHTIEFTSLIQSPEVPAGDRVGGARVVSCMRFPSAFQSEEGQDGRQKQMEDWGVKVTRNFDEAVADCDALMLEVNDPALHLKYFEPCVNLGKPIFLDKPMADNRANGAEILRLTKEKGLRVMSSSGLRFAPALIEACEAMPNPKFTSMYGPFGGGPGGELIVWYGVHAFEMLERAMGRGAKSVNVQRDGVGAVCIVEYGEGRRGVVELTNDSWVYGGALRSESEMVNFNVDLNLTYKVTLPRIIDFLRGGAPSVEIEDTFEVMCMLDAADRSRISGEKAII